MMYNKEQSTKPVSTKQRMVGLGIALLIPTVSVVLSVLLVKKGVNVTDWVKRRTEKGPEGLLGESTTSNKKIEKFSVFEKNLDPIISRPESLSIKAISLKLELNPVGLDDQGVMETPKNWLEAGWYIRGGKPGEPRNLIINGHYDTDSGAPAAFYNIAKLKYGDVVEVKDEYGRIFTYKVVILSYLDVRDPSRLEVLKDEEGKSTLTLITCGGDFVYGAGYDKRLVVKAELFD